MRIAVPLENDLGLDASICEHFGRAPYFAIITIRGEEAEVGIFENPAVEHSAGMIPEMLAGYGVKKILATRMGEKAKVFFKQFGIEVVTGVTGTLKDVIEMINRDE
jgi:predicted Fe-Mo cluster-binding NifX family protein